MPFKPIQVCDICGLETLLEAPRCGDFPVRWPDEAECEECRAQAAAFRGVLRKEQQEKWDKFIENRKASR